MLLVSAATACLRGLPLLTTDVGSLTRPSSLWVAKSFNSLILPSWCSVILSLLTTVATASIVLSGGRCTGFAIGLVTRFVSFSASIDSLSMPCIRVCSCFHRWYLLADIFVSLMFVNMHRKSTCSWEKNIYIPARSFPIDWANGFVWGPRGDIFFSSFCI